MTVSHALLSPHSEFWRHSVNWQYRLWNFISLDAMWLYFYSSKNMYPCTKNRCVSYLHIYDHHSYKRVMRKNIGHWTCTLKYKIKRRYCVFIYVMTNLKNIIDYVLLFNMIFLPTHWWASVSQAGKDEWHCEFSTHSSKW